jgi:hypothetical protein
VSTEGHLGNAGTADVAVPTMVGTTHVMKLMIVGHHALQTGASVADEHWDGTDEEELSCYVSEVRSPVSGLEYC